MPRLTNTDYYQRHIFLKKAWAEFQILYTILKPEIQWEVHDFYRPQDDISEEVLFAHRKAITKQRPSLPNKASKSYSYMLSVCEAAIEWADGDELRFRQAVRYFAAKGTITTHKPSPKSKLHRISIASLVNPRVDTQKLAVAFWLLAEQKQGKYPPKPPKDAPLPTKLDLALPSLRPRLYKERQDMN